MHAVSRIASYKKENHLPVFDPAREAEHTGRVLGLLEDESLKAYFLEWYQMTMDISKAYQETILTEES
jgi:chorismate mutase